MAKIRHIAYRSDDIEELAGFFVSGFGMEIVQRRGNGAVDLSDGSIRDRFTHPRHPRISIGSDSSNDTRVLRTRRHR